jgi:hypothetical protein
MTKTLEAEPGLLPGGAKTLEAEPGLVPGGTRAVVQSGQLAEGAHAAQCFAPSSASGALLALIAFASACPEPIYDADIGVEGVPVDAGALAGAFVLLVQASDKANVPGLEDEVGGGFTLYAVDRTFSSEGGFGYLASMVACQVNNFEVAGLTTIVSRETAESIPPMIIATDIRDDTGAVNELAFVERWALDDSIGNDDPMPEKPGDAGLVDMEGDGKPGATLVASGLANGEIYVNNRKTISLAGVVRSPDESFGLTTHKKEGFVLEATDPLLDVDAQREMHPDPKESWWHELRIPSATCDDANEAFTSGTLSRLRPF